MGLDPERGKYEVGIDNPSCHATLFDGETPKYVEARVANLKACPGNIRIPPNGTHLLTQLGTAVTWRMSTSTFAVAFELTATFSRFSIAYIRVGPPGLWFYHRSGVLCKTAFINQNVCNLPVFWGFNGTAEIYWGPAIHP